MTTTFTGERLQFHLSIVRQREDEHKTPPGKNQALPATMPETGPRGLRSREPLQSERALARHFALVG